MIEYKGEKVTVMAGSKCNINCEHCYISYKGNLTPEQLKERVSKLSKKYKVEINGAEILTDLGYLPIIKSDMPVEDNCYFTPFYEIEENQILQKWERRISRCLRNESFPAWMYITGEL